MGRPVFTPEELAEIAAADAEIDARPPTQAEREESFARDYLFRGLNATGSQKAQRAYREANREKIAEAQRAYREANREKIAEAQRAYYEANREKIAEAQRAYREANREKIAEIGAALRRWRHGQGMNQTQLGAEVNLCQRAISYWERGEVPIDFDRIELYAPRILEAFI